MASFMEKSWFTSFQLYVYYYADVQFGLQKSDRP